jgi:hypothetical protein
VLRRCIYALEISEHPHFLFRSNRTFSSPTGLMLIQMKKAALEERLFSGVANGLHAFFGAGFLVLAATFLRFTYCSRRFRF